MDIVKSVFSRSRHTLAVFGALFALVAATLLPTLASADSLTERSIQLSSATAGATNVSYTVNFTAVNAATAFTVEFCSNSSVASDTCTAPTGFTAATAASSTGTVTSTANSITDTTTITAGEAVSVAFTGITNPSGTGALYARISTVNGSTAEDNGGVAIDINSGVNVSGTVEESMTFCVSKSDMSADTEGATCADAQTPSLNLGQPVNGGSALALSPTAISTGTVYTQVSTNAAHGAVVSIKSGSTTCGGLLLAGDTTDCYIPATNTTNLVAGTAGIGLETGTSAATTGVTNGGKLNTLSGYNSSTYTLNYKSDNTTGVTSAYGDQIYNTNSAPANSMNMPLTFGATISNTTPAGSYAANYSMIATGTF